MGALLAQLSDEAEESFGEAVAEFFELLVGELDTPAGFNFNGAPALLKLAGIGLVEMSFSVALLPRLKHSLLEPTSRIREWHKLLSEIRGSNLPMQIDS